MVRLAWIKKIFTKIWSLRSNSVTRHVNLKRTKIEKFKCDIFWRFSKRRWWTWQAAESLHYDLQLKEFTMIIIKMTFGRGSIEHQKSSQLFALFEIHLELKDIQSTIFNQIKVSQQVWQRIPNVKKKPSFVYILEKQWISHFNLTNFCSEKKIEFFRQN